ncbi:hypothetical protein CVT26_008072 [Gymnopilus dilepis]|uniref:Uncharacterized protein n=1 Tax=Gymnopilus dilepis TaxID=231916 RepID=A0A409YKV8_9AGAR|nr:hypothetical protein CVT26_008072 [Gymnopilus dilepis]
MSLDQNLFTLHFTPHKDNASVIDLVDPAGTIHYRKQRVSSPEYKIEVYDPMSESLLATATSPVPTSKVKTLELYNPTSVVELKYSGTLSFRWSFKWENHDFEWKREECFMIRKPDPPVIVAVTREPSGRLKTQSVQILDYNLNRFDIDDRKGLEIVILTALLTFQDANEAYHSPEPSSSPSSNPLSRTASQVKSNANNDVAPPKPPPRPAPKTGVDRIAELQAIKGEYNEITISDEGSVEEYGEYCNRLLQDDAMLFVTVKCSEAQHVPKVLQVVEETKRIRHKAGLSEEEELHQYVLYDTQEHRKGPRRINLDDDAKNKYTPPQNLTVHLSKIPMPELQPQGHPKEKSSKESKKKEEKKAGSANSDQPAWPAPSPSPVNQSTRPMTQGAKPTTKLQKPGQSSSPRPHLHALQVHPGQPTPSPAQLNNPGIYAAPPPSRPSRPTSSQGPFKFPEPQVPGGRSSSPNFYAGQTSSFPPSNWSGPMPPPPPPPQQSNSTNDNTGLPPSSPRTQKTSNVVHGLMDKFLTRR